MRFYQRKPDVLRLAFLIITLGGLGAASWLMPYTSEEAFGIWLGRLVLLPALGLCILGFIGQIVFKKPILILNREGVIVQSWLMKPRTLRWEQIAAINLVKAGQHRFLRFVPLPSPIKPKPVQVALAVLAESEAEVLEKIKNFPPARARNAS